MNVDTNRKNNLNWNILHPWILTGSSALYGDLLRAEECSGVTIYSPVYAATEGLMGINLDPSTPIAEYVLVPNVMFFEFIPVEHSEEEKPETQLMSQVGLVFNYILLKI